MKPKPKADRERQVIADALTAATFGMLKVRPHRETHYLVIQSDALATQCQYIKEAPETGVRAQLSQVCAELGLRYTRLSKVLTRKRRTRKKRGATKIERTV